MKKTTLLCLVVAIFLSGCSSTTNTSIKNNLQTTKNNQQVANNQFIMAGKIQANDQANVASKIGGKISEISVDVGSSVNQGDTIIKLDTQDLQAQVDQAQAAVDTAKANLANATSSTRPEQLSQAQAALDSASQGYQSASQSYEIEKKNYDRIQNLVNSGAEPQQQLDLEQQKLAASESQLASAEAQQKSAQEQLNILNNGPTQSSIDVYQAQVNQAEAALKVAQTALSNATITAPISGVINAKNINVGEVVSPGVTLLSITNSNDVYVDAYAPVDITSQLKEGQVVNVKVAEVPDKQFEGKIAVINSKLNDQSTNILVKVTLSDPNSLLKPGMFAEIGLKK